MPEFDLFSASKPNRFRSIIDKTKEAFYEFEITQKEAMNHANYIKKNPSAALFDSDILLEALREYWTELERKRKRERVQ